MREDSATRAPSSADPIRSDILFRAAQVAFGLKITLLVLVFDPRAFNAFGIAKSVVGHATSVALLVLLIALWVRYRRALIAPTAAQVAALGLLVWFALATMFAVDRNVALFGISGRYLGLAQMLDDYVTLIAATCLIRSPRDAARLLAVAVAAVLPAAVYGLAQHLDIDPVRFAQGRDLVPVATLGNPDIAGGYFSIAAVTAIAAVVVIPERLTVAGRLGLVGVGGFSLYLLTLTRVRNGVLAVAAGFVAVYVLVWLWRGRRELLLASGFALAIGMAVLVSPVAARLTPAALSADPGVQERFEIWETASRQILGSPFFGVGPDNFGVAYPSTRAERSVQIAGPDVLQTSTHNWLLYTATSGGLVAVAILIVFLGLVTARAIRLIRSRDPLALFIVPLAAYLAQGSVDVNDLGLEWIFWTCSGAVLYGSSRVSARGRTRVMRNSGQSTAILVLAVAATFAFGFAETPRLAAAEAMTRSVVEVAAGHPLVGVEAARQALSLDPGRGQYWSQFATALSAAGNPSAAASAYEAALDREPWQPIYWRNLAIQRLALGQVDRASQVLGRALQADPFDVRSLDLSARLALARGEYGAALDYGQRAVRLVPAEVGLYDAPALAAIQLQRWTEGEAMLKLGIERTSSTHLKVLLVKLYAASGRRADALSLVDEVLAVDPSNTEAADLKQQLRSP